MPPELPTTESGIDEFIAAFEDGTLPKERWTHAAHLLTGACYVHAYGEAAAIDRMRERVSAYNVAVGGQNTPTSGYHETVTVFWIKVLAAYLASRSSVRSTFACEAVREFGENRSIYRDYYSYDVIASQEARLVWLPPDLRPIA